MKNKLRDPIHGFIEVSDQELKLIDTSEFQRLRRIKQLATTYLVYHGAEHTRFGHSLGVMHLATQAFDCALNNYKHQNKNKDLFDNHTREVYRQILRLITLLHDIGHAPFSHAWEINGFSHEEFTRKIILTDSIKTIINQIGTEYKEKYKKCQTVITADLISLFFCEDDTQTLKANEYKFADFKFIKSFLSSDLDCDKMDYLLRDSHYCGVNYGKFDLNRLLNSLSVCTINGTKQLGYLKSGLQALEEFVMARYFMFIQVYFHKTRRFLDILLSKCTYYLSENGHINMANIEEFLKLDDATVWNKIREIADQCPWANDLTNRTIFARVYESETFKTLEGMKRFIMAKEEIQRKKIRETDYIIDEVQKMPHSWPVINPYDDDKGYGIPILNQNNDPENIAAVSIVIKRMGDDLISIKRIYVRKTHEKLITAIRKKYRL